MTSQEPLKTAAGQIYRLDTLALPAGADVQSPTAVAAGGAGALFVARARAVAPRFDISTTKTMFGLRSHGWISFRGTVTRTTASPSRSAALQGTYLPRRAGMTEAFERTLAPRPWVNVSTAPELAARSWGALARYDAIAGSAESYEAAVRAEDLFRLLDDEAGPFLCLSWQIAIGARRGDAASLERCVDEARRIDRPTGPMSMRAGFRRACYRLQMSQGRIEEARASALERARLGRDEGFRCTSRSSSATTLPTA